MAPIGVIGGVGIDPAAAAPIKELKLPGPNPAAADAAYADAYGFVAYFAATSLA